MSRPPPESRQVVLSQVSVTSNYKEEMDSRVVVAKYPAEGGRRLALRRNSPCPVYELGEAMLEAWRPAPHRFFCLQLHENAIFEGRLEFYQGVGVRFSVTGSDIANEITKQIQLCCPSIR